MPFPLFRHPDTPCAAVREMSVDVVRTKTGLKLVYAATGVIADLRLPAPAAPRRAELLWEHSCFEVFARVVGDPSYQEYNFAPSSAWAAYHFTHYRAGMAELELDRAPDVLGKASPESYTLSVTVDNLGLAPTQNWSIGVSAVIEELSGQKSYWALAHPPGQADFHHDDCFALTLSPMETT